MQWGIDLQRISWESFRSFLGKLFEGESTGRADLSISIRIV